jgi:hypothetical protein
MAPGCASKTYCRTHRIRHLDQDLIVAYELRMSQIVPPSTISHSRFQLRPHCGTWSTEGPRDPSTKQVRRPVCIPLAVSCWGIHILCKLAPFCHDSVTMHGN